MAKTIFFVSCPWNTFAVQRSSSSLSRLYTHTPHRLTLGAYSHPTQSRYPPKSSSNKPRDQYPIASVDRQMPHHQATSKLAGVLILFQSSKFSVNKGVTGSTNIQFTRMLNSITVSPKFRQSRLLICRAPMVEGALKISQSEGLNV